MAANISSQLQAQLQQVVAQTASTLITNAIIFSVIGAAIIILGYYFRRKAKKANKKTLIPLIVIVIGILVLAYGLLEILLVAVAPALFHAISNSTS